MLDQNTSHFARNENPYDPGQHERFLVTREMTVSAYRFQLAQQPEARKVQIHPV